MNAETKLNQEIKYNYQALYFKRNLRLKLSGKDKGELLPLKREEQLLLLTIWNKKFLFLMNHEQVAPQFKLKLQNDWKEVLKEHKAEGLFNGTKKN